LDLEVQLDAARLRQPSEKSIDWLVSHPRLPDVEFEMIVQAARRRSKFPELSHSKSLLSDPNGFFEVDEDAREVGGFSDEVKGRGIGVTGEGKDEDLGEQAKGDVAEIQEEHVDVKMDVVG